VIAVLSEAYTELKDRGDHVSATGILPNTQRPVHGHYKLVRNGVEHGAGSDEASALICPRSKRGKASLDQAHGALLSSLRWLLRNAFDGMDTQRCGASASKQPQMRNDVPKRKKHKILF
jgi:hypothetical protein